MVHSQAEGDGPVVCNYKEPLGVSHTGSDHWSYYKTGAAGRPLDRCLVCKGSAATATY